MLCPVILYSQCIAECLAQGSVYKGLLKKLLSIAEPGHMVIPLAVTESLPLGIADSVRMVSLSSEDDIVSSDSRDNLCIYSLQV